MLCALDMVKKKLLMRGLLCSKLGGRNLLAMCRIKFNLLCVGDIAIGLVGEDLQMNFGAGSADAPGQIVVVGCRS